jgi:hypothetical protein
MNNLINSNILDYVHGGNSRHGERDDNVAIIDDQEVFKGLSTYTGDCVNNPGPDGVCVSNVTLEVISDFTADIPRGALKSTPKNIMKYAKELTKCDTEYCVLKDPRVMRLAHEKGVISQLKEDERVKFKPKGPRNTLDLLSNYDIDGVLQRWAISFDTFYPCPFAMMDFDSHHYKFGDFNFPAMLEGKLSFNGIKKPFNCFGCVLNTDVSTGPGKHWVAVFVDCRDPTTWSIEYFNSVGKPPTRPVINWMERNCVELQRCTTGTVTTVSVTDLDHQESQTECGLYSLYYIRRRLENTPYTFFMKKIIPDDTMTEFRKHVFRE